MTTKIREIKRVNLNEINNEAGGEEEQTQWHDDSCSRNSHGNTDTRPPISDAKKERFRRRERAQRAIAK